MIGTLGLLSGAAKTNLLDATMYLAGVSGATWAIVPFFYQSACMQKNSLQTCSDLYAYFSNALSDGTRFCLDDYCTPALLDFAQSDDFLQELTLRYGYNQDITLVNFFGALITKQSLGFLDESKLNLTWSMTQDQALSANSPLPLCATAFRNQSDYEYFEMSPFQAGSSLLGYIPTQYLGSGFSNKKLDLNNICPEYPLGFYMGMYGSSFAAVIQDLYQAQSTKYKKLIPYYFYVKKLI